MLKSISVVWCDSGDDELTAIMIVGYHCCW